MLVKTKITNTYNKFMPGKNTEQLLRLFIFSFLFSTHYCSKYSCSFRTHYIINRYCVGMQLLKL